MRSVLNRFFPGRQARVVVSFSFAFLLIVGVAVATQLQHRYAWAYSQLEDIAPRHARMVGMELERERLVAIRDQSVTTLGERAYAAEMSADRVGTDLQQRVRQLVDAQGMNVLQSQILPAREAVALSEVPLVLAVEGGAESLRNLLLAFATARPSIQVDAIVVQSAGSRAGSGAVRVQLELSAYHLFREPK